MSPYVRKVRTASGATAVQIVAKEHGVRRIVEHLGSAHDEAELAALIQAGREKIRGGQGVLDLAGLAPRAARQAVAPAVVDSKRSVLLWDVLTGAYEMLGLGEATGGDEGFMQMVLARLVEPTSKEQVPRVISELGVGSVSRASLFRSLSRCAGRQWRDRIAAACLSHVTGRGDLSLCLYDVTTLYFEAEKEDDLRRVGYSKERRVGPQVIVGLLVDRAGFPLRVGCWEGSKAETSTLIPMVEEFRKASGIEHLVVVADAGMLSAGNLQALHDAGMGFIVGSRMTKAPADLAAHFAWRGDAFTDGQVIDTITPRKGATSRERDRNVRDEPVWSPVEFPGSWRAIWAYSARRFARDNKTLTAQENRARAVVAGHRRPKGTRFVTTRKGDQVLDDKALARAKRLAGLKGYVSNIPATVMPASEVIASYHELWHVEQSFRMSKHDLRARPVFHHTHDAIQAHLTVVMAALAVARHLQAATGISIKQLVRELRPLQEVTITINGHHITAQPQTTQTAQQILESLNPGH
ncbi:IS1634 family transposase [Actinomyces glycerinitolerans]|uniref:IS1634 family transposase n=1 Tax=Actinomyces glycerinitolerans TaxID=1892869 RepID=UPI000932804F|nr:IS1634 family transposase [Actinomyces glycerinitolerans]